MENRPLRISFSETPDKTRIIIKSNNTMLGSFFILLALTACFTALVLVFNALGFVISRGPLAAVLGWLIAGIAVLYKVLVAVEVIRAAAWSLAGSEVVDVSALKFIYSKKISAIGRVISFNLNEISAISEVNYAEARDIFYIAGSEIGIGSRSLMLECGPKRPVSDRAFPWKNLKKW